jgi:hypothetical protein
VITRGIRDYVSRDWQAVRESKDDYWGRRISRMGAAEGLRVADELRRQALLMNDGWPSAADRAADLASHARVAELMRRADSARRS